MAASFLARIVFVFALAGLNCRETKRQPAATDTVQHTMSSIVLSPAHPLAALPYPLGSLKAIPETMAFSVDHIVNPASDLVSIAVYLRNGNEKKSIGLFSLYPSNRPGNFTARINTVIGSAKKDWAEKDWPAVQLCFELQEVKNIKDRKLSVEITELHL